MSYRYMKSVFWISFLICISCAQEDIDLPDAGTGGGGECGSWYPGSSGDGGVVYGYNEGDTLPCFLWESVRIHEKGEIPNTYLSMSGINLMYQKQDLETTQQEILAKFGIAGPIRSLLFAVSARNCPACQELLPEISALKDQFHAAGTIMVGVAFSDLQAEGYLELDESEEVLLSIFGDMEWREEWHRTNDAEHYLDIFDSFPNVIVIRLSDMKVILNTPSSASVLSNPHDLSPLIDLVNRIDEL